MKRIDSPYMCWKSSRMPVFCALWGCRGVVWKALNEGGENEKWENGRKLRKMRKG